jgi:oligopeptide transport system substrate-binding protein
VKNSFFFNFVALCFVLGLNSKARATSSSATTADFRIPLLAEIQNLDLTQQRNSSVNFVSTQIYWPLLILRNGVLQPGLAESCEYKKEKLVSCSLKKDLKWSDGTPLTARDIIDSFRSFIDPKNKTIRVDLLFPLLNAREIWSGEKKPHQLGVRTNKQGELIFQLAESHREFIFHLALPVLAPQKRSHLFVTSGPYRFVTPKLSLPLRLEPNPFFDSNSSERPHLQFLLVREDNTALLMFDRNELDFVRRIPTPLIPKLRHRPEYFEVTQVRFDYIGMSGKLKTNTELKTKIAESINYDQLTKFFHARPRPGCAGIPSDFFHGPLCWNFKSDSPSEKTALSFEFVFSNLGGDSHQKSAELIQSDLTKKNIKLILSGLENKAFLDRLRDDPPDLFRKGNNLDRPTCSAVLELFESNSAENTLPIKSKRLDEIIGQMKSTSREERKRELCTEGLRILMFDHHIIPTGPIYFSYLLSSKYTGAWLNEFNQLYLVDLKRK